MIIRPLRRQAPRPVTLLVPGWRTLTAYTESGVLVAHGSEHCYGLLTSLQNHVAYVSTNLRELVHVTGATHWTADIWRGRATTMHLDGTTLAVTSLRRTLSGAADAGEQFAALLQVVGFLADQGVRAGSLSSMAWRLWRSTLVSPLEVGFDSRVARAAFFGGRKGASRPHAYRDQVAVDIAKAYPHAMISRPYAGLMREVSRETALDGQVAGLAKVRVHVPETLRFPTLPVRLGPSMIQWRYGDIEGVYTWGELAAAREFGTEIEVLRCWAPLTEVAPFGPWWSLMLDAYETLPPLAVKLVKALGNLVWSHFAMTADDTASLRWEDDYGDHPMTVPRPRRDMPQGNTVHLAAETSARVRTRMLTEGLYGDHEDPVHVDTDGIIVSAASARRRRTGDAVGQWRAKTFMDLVEIRAPQLYRYTCGESCGVDHSRYHYVAAGTPREHAAALFEGHPGFQISMTGLDTVVPAGRALEEREVQRYEIAESELHSLVYGPPLRSYRVN